MQLQFQCVVNAVGAALCGCPYFFCPKTYGQALKVVSTIRVPKYSGNWLDCCGLAIQLVLCRGQDSWANQYTE